MASRFVLSASTSGAEAINYFLKSAKERVVKWIPRNGTSQRNVVPGEHVHLILGNEASDADSIVSAVVYGFALSKGLHGSNAIVHLPVVSVPREDFRLRCETVAFLKKLNIDTDAIVFSDDVDFLALVNGCSTTVTLVDHNKLSTQWEFLDRHVVEIMDHHADMGSHASVTGETRNIAFEFCDGEAKALVGSCCTLIAERMKQSNMLESLTATLLLGVITLDTVNFNASAGKVTARDRTALGFLEEQSLAPHNELYDFLQFEKFSPKNWKDFTVQECLRYDYKQFTAGDWRYGISAVLIDIPTFLEKDHQIVEQLSFYMDQKDLDFLVIMSMTTAADSTPQRQILTYTHKSRSSDVMSNFLTAATDRLRLEVISLEDLGRSWSTLADCPFRAYNQLNVVVSRKQVVPMLQEFLLDHLST